MSQDVILTVMNSMSLNNDSVNMEMQECESCEKYLNLDVELSKSKQAYNDFLKNYSQLEKHCIHLEASMQLQQEVFQNDESCVNQNAVEIQEYLEVNDLKARLQDKDKTICKLKATIKSLRENTKEENVNPDKCDLEPINKELEIGKKLLKMLYAPSATTIAPGIFKLDLEPFPPRLLQNREVHIDYLRNTQEQANILWEIVEQAKAKQPLDSELDFACKYATRIQELLLYVQDTCPSAIIPSAKKVTVKPMNNVKKVRFAEPLTSSSNIKQVESSNTSDSNTPVLSSTGVKCSTSNYRLKPPGNKRNDKILQTPSRNKKNKHSLSKANSKILCATCNKSMFDGVHDKCLLDLVQNGNNRTKSAKKHKKQNVWKPTGHVFTEVGFKWKPTGRIFTIVGCPDCTVRFGNDQIARIMGYGDYQLGNVVISRVYVDDIIFGSTKKQMSNEFETLMHDKFQMSSMGELSFFLRLQVKQKSDEIFISQDKYVAEILKKFDFASVKTASTPMETNNALVKDEEAEDVDVHLYRSMIRSLMYLTASRLDIMFAVCACASLDRKSTTGGCQFLGKRLISWQCVMDPKSDA
ncbi:integrase, catalytic region, zinc finger, CCHC-type containing protein [Tanacetum coccineum]